MPEARGRDHQTTNENADGVVEDCEWPTNITGVAGGKQNKVPAAVKGGGGKKERNPEHPRADSTGDRG